MENQDTLIVVDDAHARRLELSNYMNMSAHTCWSIKPVASEMYRSDTARPIRLYYEDLDKSANRQEEAL